MGRENRPGPPFKQIWRIETILPAIWEQKGEWLGTLSKPFQQSAGSEKLGMLSENTSPQVGTV